MQDFTELDTPALIVDMDVMERNLGRAAEYCRNHGLQLRPHTKTHKSPKLARLQLESGACGLTVAKLGEAEVFSAAGLDNLMLAYPVFGHAKARRLAELARSVDLSISLDSEQSLEWTVRAADGCRIEVLVEIDFGMRRCGLPPGEQPVLLAQKIESSPGLRFGGVMFYAGHAHPDFEGNDRKVQRLNEDLNRQLDLFRKAGLQPPRVSGGSTPSLFYSHLVEGLTEIRPGTYIFNDRNTVEWKACSWDDCAASVLVTVVSANVPGQAIIDGGSKTFSSDLLANGAKSGFGLVKEFPEIEFFRMNEEHGYLRLPEGLSLQPGQKLRIIPNHVCAAVNLHERVWGIREGQVADEWDVAARGKIR